MRELSCRRIQVDEIWSYVGKRQGRLEPGGDRSRLGDMWTFVALDPETKLVPTYRVGKRTRPHAVTFMADLSERQSNRVRLSSNALNTYVDAVERASEPISTMGRRSNFTKRSRLVRGATVRPASLTSTRS